jgi:hypothetical protein
MGADLKIVVQASFRCAAPSARDCAYAVPMHLETLSENEIFG